MSQILPTSRCFGCPSSTGEVLKPCYTIYIMLVGEINEHHFYQVGNKRMEKSQTFINIFADINIDLIL